MLEVYWSFKVKLSNNPKMFILHLITRAKIDVPIDTILNKAASIGVGNTLGVGVENTSDIGIIGVSFWNKIWKKLHNKTCLKKR